MANSVQDYLYKLLPAIYRTRDEKQTLRTLMAIMEQELLNVESLITKAYADCFIETCSLDILPFIASLLGTANLHKSEKVILTDDLRPRKPRRKRLPELLDPQDIQDKSILLPGQRRLLANTIRYRRSKGQPGITEHITYDATGWSAKLFESFKYLTLTQDIRFPKLQQGAYVSIKDMNTVETINTALDTNAHRPEIRNKEVRNTKYNVPELNLSIWRLQSFPLQKGYACLVSDRRYTFHPFGIDTLLFNKPYPIDKITQQASEINLPTPIRLRAFMADIMDYKRKYSNLEPELRPVNSMYYGPDASINIVEVIEQGGNLIKNTVSPDRIVVADLSMWSLPLTEQLPADTVYVDPVLGRIALHPHIPVTPLRLEVDYYYGLNAEIGGGYYSRLASLAVPDAETAFITVGQTVTGADAISIQKAIEIWQGATPRRKRCIIQILDNATYEEVDIFNFNQATDLIIQAADGCRPCLKHKTAEYFKIANNATEPVSITLNGILVHGRIDISGKIKLTVNHCTLDPNREYAVAFDEQAALSEAEHIEVIIQNSLTAGFYLPPQATALSISDSIVDSYIYSIAGNYADNAIPCCPLQVERSTIIGRIHAIETKLISESILVDDIKVIRLQNGCVRYSYLPSSSQTPQRYRCISEATLEDDASGGIIVPDRDSSGIPIKIKLQFISRFYGEPHYLELSRNTSTKIRLGAENGTEMGAFNKVYNPQREAELKHIIEEYLPANKESSVNFVEHFIPVLFA